MLDRVGTIRSCFLFLFFFLLDLSLGLEALMLGRWDKGIVAGENGGGGGTP